MSEAKPQLDAVLFDLDGVLADSELWWNEIDAAMLAEHGIDYKGEHKQQVLGKSSKLALEFYRAAYELRTELSELAVRRHYYAAQYYAEQIPVFESAPAVLAAVKARGLRIGLATSSVGKLILPFLERHNLTHFFDGLTTGEEVTRGKPDPDIYLLAARKVGAEPARCLVVEDALAGIASGKAAGMAVVAIPDPRFVNVEEHRAAADFVMTELGELPALLDSAFRCGT